MATQVKIKRGTTNTNAPTGLTAGEMAINLVDKKLYVGGTAGTNVIFLDSTSSVGLSTANTFTALQTFSAGISAAGATFTGSISGATATFSKDIKVNTMTVGLGKSSDTTNVAIGVLALASDTSDYDTEGVSNTAIGSNALNANTTGSSNVGVGQNALFQNTTGGDNVGVGTNAFYTNTTGSSNVGVGQNALFQNTTGGSNVGVGSSALGLNNTGNNNVGVGQYALLFNTTGSNKTAIGSEAGAYRGTATDNLTTGTGGIYIGYQARGSTLAQTNEIVIGVNALGLGSNTAVIGATLQSAATIYGVLNLPSGLSASGATFTGNISARNIVTSFNGATGAVTGVSSFNGLTGAVTGASLGANTFTALNSFNAGISASGATFSAPITSTRMARHTSAAISAQKTVDFTPTAAEDGTVFYINYTGKGSVTVTLDGLPIGWRAKFLNVGNGTVYFTTTGDGYGEGFLNFLSGWLMEAICIDTDTYFVG